MAPPSREPYTPPPAPTGWDRGACGPANRHHLRREPATDIDPETGRETLNPNAVYRYRRRCWVTVYARQGRLSPSQVAAADKLRLAAEGMRERDPLEAIGEARHPSGASALEAMVDARRYFRALWARIPTASRPVIERVVLDNRPIWSGVGGSTRDRHMRRLRDGLDAIS